MTAPAVAVPGPSRAECLASALRRLGTDPGASLAVLVCADHRDDRAVAAAAAALIGARVALLPVERPDDELHPALGKHRGGLLLACSEGVDRWRRSGVPMRVVGDGPGVLWWRLLELQEHAHRLAAGF